MASELPFYDIFAPTKNSSFPVFDDVIACDLWFGSPQSKILATPMITKLVFQNKTAKNLQKIDLYLQTRISYLVQGVQTKNTWSLF